LDADGLGGHHERNHQGLDNALIAPVEAVGGTGKLVRRERLGGLRPSRSPVSRFPLAGLRSQTVVQDL
jgi:hypothetical protein